MATERIDIVVSTEGAPTVVRDLKDIGDEAKATTSALDVLKKTLRALGVYWAANEIKRAADEYQGLQNKLLAAGVAQTNLADTTARLTQIANSSYSALDGVGTLYARMTPAAKELGATQEQLFKFVQASSQALAINGTQGAAASGALLQLSQAMGGAYVRGQEFKSILDGMRPLVQVVANHLDAAGGSVARLQQIMKSGKLTVKDFFEAALKGLHELSQKILLMSPTFSQAGQVLKNFFVVAVGGINKALGASVLFSKAVVAIVPHLDAVMTALLSIGAATAVFVGMPALISLITTRLSALWLVMEANPFIAMATLITAASIALYRYRDDIKIGIDATTTLGDVMVATGQVTSEWWTKAKNAIGEIATTAQHSASANSQSFGAIGSTFGSMWELLSAQTDKSWAQILRDDAAAIDNLVGLYRGGVVTIIGFFADLPSAMGDYFYQGVNIAIGTLNALGQKTAEIATSIAKGLGSNKVIEFEDIVKVNNTFEGRARQLGANMDINMREGIASSHGATDTINEILKKAQELSAAKSKSAGVTDPNSSTAPPQIDPEFAKELKRLRDHFDGVRKAQYELEKGIKTLDQGVAVGAITMAERNRLITLMKAELRDALDPLAAVNRELDRQSDLLKLTNKEQEVSNQLYKETQALMKKGVLLNEQETKALEDKLRALQHEKELYGAINSIREAGSIAREKEFTQTEATAIMIKRGGQDALDAKDAYIKAQGDKMIGTKDYYDFETRQSAYAKELVTKNLQAGVIDKREAERQRLSIQLHSHDQSLSAWNRSLNGLAALQNSHNKKMAAVGKSAAIAQALINTYQGATGAFTAMSVIPFVGPILGVAAAAAAVAAGLAQVQQIRSTQTPAFAFGGEMQVGGVGGTDSQNVAFRATPGEIVRVTTPSQEREAAKGRSAGGDTFVFHMPNVTKERDVKESTATLVAQVAQVAARAQRYS